MKSPNQSWPAYFSLWILLSLCIGLFIISKYNSITFRDPWFSPAIKSISETTNHGDESDMCVGRYIYIHDLPSIFNADIIKNCSGLYKWYPKMCTYVSNMGLGPPIVNSQGVLQGNNWYLTNQFTLEIIFHSKMKKYKCLTKNSSLASAVYVPFYPGLELGRNLWDTDTSTRDRVSNEFLNWIVKKPEWKYMNGQDHFLVAGRLTVDFRRPTDNQFAWGNKLFLSPQAKNMTLLIIEACPDCKNKDIAIPYPSYFHPKNDIEVYDWQKKVRNEKRQYLYAFVGAPRPTQKESIRNEIITQCVNSTEKYCKWFDCSSVPYICDDPIQVMRVFQSADFCLQPAGDTPTRRSAFDSMLAGCIPVYFRPDSAYTQYKWHLPKNYTKYSVFIPEKGIKEGTENITEILRKIPEEEVKRMREEVVSLIPKITYSNPVNRLKSIEDAFDITIKKVLEKVEKTRREIKESVENSS